MKPVMIITTVPDIDTGQKIANYLVEEKLAACVNIIPRVTSIYRWQGQIQTDTELLVLIKSTQSMEHTIYEAVKDMHPYELPELITVSIDRGDGDYLQWITDSVRHVEK